MDLWGEGRAIPRDKLLELARQGAVDVGMAQACLDRALVLVDELPVRAQAHPIRGQTLRRIQASVAAHRGTRCAELRSAWAAQVSARPP